jgi:hypothetical protein
MIVGHVLDQAQTLSDLLRCEFVLVAVPETTTTGIGAVMANAMSFESQMLIPRDGFQLCQIERRILPVDARRALFLLDSQPSQCGFEFFRNIVQFVSHLHAPPTSTNPNHLHTKVAPTSPRFDFERPSCVVTKDGPRTRRPAAIRRAALWAVTVGEGGCPGGRRRDRCRGAYTSR